MPVNEKSRCSAGGTWTSGGAAGEGRPVVVPFARSEAVRAEGAEVARMFFLYYTGRPVKDQEGNI